MDRKICQNCLHRDNGFGNHYLGNDGTGGVLQCGKKVLVQDDPDGCGGFDAGDYATRYCGVPAAVRQRLSDLAARYANSRCIWSSIPQDRISLLHEPHYHRAAQSYVDYLCERLELPAGFIKVKISAGLSVPAQIQLGKYVNTMSLSPEFADARDLLGAALGHETAHALNYRLFEPVVLRTPNYLEEQATDATSLYLGLGGTAAIAYYRNDVGEFQLDDPEDFQKIEYRRLGYLTPEISGFCLERRTALAIHENVETILTDLGVSPDRPEFHRVMKGVNAARQVANRRYLVEDDGVTKVVFHCPVCLESAKAPQGLGLLHCTCRKCNTRHAVYL